MYIHVSAQDDKVLKRYTQTDRQTHTHTHCKTGDEDRDGHTHISRSG